MLTPSELALELYVVRSGSCLNQVDDKGWILQMNSQGLSLCMILAKMIKVNKLPSLILSFISNEIHKYSRRDSCKGEESCADNGGPVVSIGVGNEAREGE